ncbi:FKBP-type peptidyl-prolyl cis-trans isomerase SlyD [Fibrobacter sp. UWP2]|nr:FKBP-type peptidyl-prolyl cis-trans isomerase SlyD [Fibrobacter sp. UWP2]
MYIIFYLYVRMDFIEDKTKVSIAYTLKELNGRILEEVPAKFPFVYIHGYNNIIPGLETALLGRKLGEKFSVEIPANLGYGLYRKDLLIQVPKEELQEVGELWLGMELEMFMDNDIREFQLPDTADEFCDDLNLDGEDESDGIYIVKEIYKDTVLVDGNHPFAGKDLIFDVEVVGIETPSYTELENGFPDKDEFDEGYDDNYDDRYDNEGGYSDNENRRWR